MSLTPMCSVAHYIRQITTRINTYEYNVIICTCEHDLYTRYKTVLYAK